jgi:cytochrome oxidase Cu insertion factor (SCO1/SenC/PrrC family)
MSENDSGSRSNFTLWLILAVCVAPFAGSFIAYHFWKPAGQVNYGTLLEPAPLPAAPLALADGRAFGLADLKGRWVLVTLDAGACDEYCRKKLWVMRQVRLTQGKDMQRVERLWLVTDAAPVVARAGAGGLAAAFPADGRSADHIYLVDPLGNLVLRYPRDADPSRMKKDLTRLLKVSRTG